MLNRHQKLSTKVLTAHVPADLIDKLDHMADRLERSRAWILKQALNDWIEQEEERYRLTLEGLNDVKTGHVIDHKDIKAWADSLDSKKPKQIPTC